MDIRKIDLNLLVVFDALMQTQSVSRAAERLGLSQPAMSYSLKRLRDLFDDPLLVRVGGGMQPTPRAETLFESVHAVVQKIQSEVLETREEFQPAKARMTLTLNMQDIGELVFMPRLAERIQQMAPGIDLSTVYASPGHLEEALRTGEINLVVGYFPELKGTAIYQQRLFSHDFVCLLRTEHPISGKKLTRHQYFDSQHVLVHPDGKSHESFEKALLERGLKRRFSVMVSHYLAVPAILERSDLIATVPYGVGRCLAGMGKIKMMRPPINVPSVDIMQFWHARYHTDSVNRWLRQQVADLFIDQPW